MGARARPLPRRAARRPCRVTWQRPRPHDGADARCTSHGGDAPTRTRGAAGEALAPRRAMAAAPAARNPPCSCGV
eukprot:329370-Prymnesium_polylepis.2